MARRRPLSRRNMPLLVIVIIAALLALREFRNPTEPTSPGYVEEGSWQVKRVVDGDTLVLVKAAQQLSIDTDEKPQEIRVRLIGADTPETKKPGHPIEEWGPEATEFTEQFVASGTVRLQMDQERVDKYQRILGYLWVESDDGEERMLNEELIRAGLARAKLKYRFSKSMKKRFARAEEEAKEAHRGIWSE